jgi:hypothetical protein
VRVCVCVCVCVCECVLCLQHGRGPRGAVDAPPGGWPRRERQAAPRRLPLCTPARLPAAPRAQVTPESLLLHYYSNRPGLWPIVVGVLKGMSQDYFKLDLAFELLHSRDKGDADHEVRVCACVCVCLVWWVWCVARGCAARATGSMHQPPEPTHTHTPFGCRCSG